jgi:hypothetical protein
MQSSMLFCVSHRRYSERSGCYGRLENLDPTFPVLLAELLGGNFYHPESFVQFYERTTLMMIANLPSEGPNAGKYKGGKIKKKKQGALLAGFLSWVAPLCSWRG